MNKFLYNNNNNDDYENYNDNNNDSDNKSIHIDRHTHCFFSIHLVYGSILRNF